MKRILLYFRFGFLTAFLFPVSLCAQSGGSSCAIALATPLSLPFSTSGTTCGAPNTFTPSGITSNCLAASYLKSDEWLYCFCSTQTGTCAITLNNLSPVFPDAAISVWQGCPSANSCLGAVTQLVSGSVSMTLNVVQGSCYFILISNSATALTHCFSYDMTVEMIPPPSAPNAGCTNLDFGTGDFTGWTGTDGNIVCASANAFCPNYLIASSGLPSPQHTIVTTGTDGCGAFPVVFPGTNYSVMLGDGTNSGAAGGTLEQTFSVGAANAQLVYHYAVVIQNGGHQPSQQPFFSVDIFDQNNLPVQCAHFLVVADSTIPGFFKSACAPNVYYRPWSAVNVDLSAYIGQAVTIKFTVGDCCLGAHFGYAYVDCSCARMKISGTDSTCIGGSVTLNAPVGFAGYSWSPGNETTTGITVSPTAQTIYTVTMSSVTNKTCLSVLTDTVKIVPGPQAAFVYQIIKPSCSGGLVGFTNTSAGAITCSWNFGDSTTSASNNPTHNYPRPGSYVVTLVVHSKLGCADSVRQILVQTGIGAGALVSSPLCSDSTGTVTAMAAGGTLPYTYSWHTTPPQTSQTATMLVPGTYTVTVTDSLGCTTTTIARLVAPAPVVATISPSAPFFCKGQSAQLVALTSGGTAPYTCSWRPGALSGDSVLVSPASSCAYNLQVKDRNGCPARDSVVLTLLPLPSLAFSTDTAACAPYCASFKNNSSGGALYLWTFGDGDSTLQSSPVHCYNEAGQYTITLTGKSSPGCVQKLVLNNYMHVYPPSVAAFTASPASVSVFDPKVCFVNTSSAGLIPFWHFGDAKNTVSAEENPCFAFTEAGTYCVRLNVRNENGCTDSTVHCITVKPDPVIYVPNCFSPNGDGLNDFFLPLGENIDPARYQIWVFDRWGNTVWQTSVWGQGWDGRLRSGADVVQQDVYIWKIECWDMEMNFIRMEGRVTVVK